MIDVFGRELIVTSLDRKSVVTLDKFVGVENSTHQTNISTVVNSTAMHVGDIIIVHPVKLYQPARGEFTCFFCSYYRQPSLSNLQVCMSFLICLYVYIMSYNANFLFFYFALVFENVHPAKILLIKCFTKVFGNVRL